MIMKKVKQIISSIAAGLIKIGRVEDLSIDAHKKIDHATIILYQLSEKVDGLYSMHDKIEILYNLSEKTDILLRRTEDMVKISPEIAIIREIDRLDGYLDFHSRRIQELIEARTSVLYSNPGMDAIIKAGGFDLVVPSREIGLLSYITRHGLDAIEPGVRNAMRRHVKPGDVVLDVGTNIGAHSVLMAQIVGPHGRFIGFEALPHLVDAVRKSLNLNGLTLQSEVIHSAVADKPGELQFFAADHSPYSSIFALDATEARSTTVKATTLDDTIPPGLAVNFIKLDIEGAEPLAWKGMSRVVSESPDLIFTMEWSASHFARSGNDASGLMRDIQGQGFVGWQLNDESPGYGTLVDSDGANSIEGGNIIFSRNRDLYA